MSKMSAATSAVARLMANFVQGRAATVVGGTATAVTTTVALTTVIDGIARAFAAITNTALSPLLTADVGGGTTGWLQPSGVNAFYTQPAGTTVYYLLVVNSAGTVKVVQGTYTGQVIAPGLSVLGNSQIPDCPDGWVPFSIMKIVSGGAIFTPGTTALTSISTFYDIAVLPVADTL